MRCILTFLSLSYSIILILAISFLHIGSGQHECLANISAALESLVFPPAKLIPLSSLRKAACLFSENVVKVSWGLILLQEDQEEEEGEEEEEEVVVEEEAPKETRKRELDRKVVGHVHIIGHLHNIHVGLCR